MGGNRFEFLEIGEDGTPLPRERAVEAEQAVPLIGSEPCGPRAPDGTPLAHVRVTDPRGYFAFQEEVRRGEAAGPKSLRVAEVFGGQGAGLGQFNAPTGLAVDGSGVLFVADSYNHRVQRITPDGGVSLLGTRGSGRGQFLSPQGIATDTGSAFYIVEQGNNRVQKYSALGALQLIFGRAGQGPGEMRGPTGIAVAPGTGDIYVADTGNRRVQRFDREGNFLSHVGAQGRIARPLVSPQALAVDAWDNLFVADTFAHRIFGYDPLGRLLTDFRPTGLQEPRALACDPSGVLYVADTTPAVNSLEPAPGRLQALDGRTGQVRDVIAPPRGTGPLARPGGLAVTEGGLYVADTLNHRVLRYVWS